MSRQRMTVTGAVLEATDRTPPYGRSRPLTVGPVDLDPPAAHEVLVEIEATGVCHSDLSVVDGTRLRPTPMLLGHESAGRVIETGADVETLSTGDRVVLTFVPRCRDCSGCRSNGRLPCTAGTAANADGTLLGGGIRLHRDGQRIHHHLGVSGFATHAVVSEFSAVRIDDDIPADVAAVLGCAVLTGGGAVLNTVRPEPGQTLAVVGLGGVGVAALLTALSLDDVEVVGIDALDDKVQTALALGAHRAMTPEQAQADGVRADVVIEAAGHARAFETAFALTRAGGATVTVGLPSPDARSSIPPLTITAEARTIIGSYLGSAVPSRDIPVFAGLWRAGRLPVERLISAHIPLNEINEGMDALKEGRALRQVVTFT